MQTYLFYDIETTGLSKPFDQVLQFAAIRTDLQLRELQRYELAIRLNPDIIPSPKAMLTHRMSIAEMQQGIPEYEAIQQIHAWMNQPGTISLGYNTLGFDDEFLRFSFYRHLLPPYTHQYANQCGRMDIYPITVMFYLFKNTILKWPAKLKLELINQENQLSQGRAHHAMTDVEVTLALARKFFAEKDMWDFLQKFFNKAAEQTYFNKEFSDTPFVLMIHGVFGREKSFQAPMLWLGNHRHYKNQTVWLRLDTLSFDNTVPPEETWAIFKKWGEPEFILPPKSRFLTQLSKERLSLAEANHAWLQQHPDYFAELVNYHCEYQYPVHPKTDIDASLYLNGFWNAAEEAFCRAFSKAALQEKSRLIEQAPSSTVKTLAIRLLGRHDPAALSTAQRESFTAYLQQTRSTNPEEQLYDFKGLARLTPHIALQEIAALSNENLSSEEKNLLAELASLISNTGNP